MTLLELDLVRDEVVRLEVAVRLGQLVAEGPEGGRRQAVGQRAGARARGRSERHRHDAGAQDCAHRNRESASGRCSA